MIFYRSCKLNPCHLFSSESTEYDVTHLLICPIVSPLTAGCQQYPLSDTSGYISSLDLCGRAPEDPSKYPNNAEWSFVYTNSQTSTKWFNADYEANLENSQGCVFDSLTFGDPERSDHVIVCGQQTGAVSRECLTQVTSAS